MKATSKILRSRNFPDTANPAIQQQWETQLETVLKGLDLLPHSPLKSIFLGILYQIDITDIIDTHPDIILGEDGRQVKVYFFEEPSLQGKKLAEQSTKDSIFRLRLENKLKSFLEGGQLQSSFPLTVICVYNNPDAEKFFNDLAFSAFKSQATAPKSKGPQVQFIPTTPMYTLDRVILSDQQEEEIRKTLVLIQKQHIIYQVFGFEEIEPRPKAILNFHGPSGTGKTITAHAVAHALEKKLLALNYAEIESKYVGEAPKNLVAAFEAAQQNDAVLFFDEADSFLGKRIRNVSSSSDQAVNSLRSQMLILLEQHQGVVIFATNLVENYDPAFESRILKHLKFELPDEQQRRALLKVLIPSRLPYFGNIPFSEDQLQGLVSLSEGASGRLLKNAILDGITNAVVDDRLQAQYSDFEAAFEQMQQKLKDSASNDSEVSTIKLSDEAWETLGETVSKEMTRQEEDVSIDSKTFST